MKTTLNQNIVMSVLAGLLVMLSACDSQVEQQETDIAEAEVTEDTGAYTASLETFSLAQVRLLDSPFLAAQQTDKQYILEMEPDRLLAPFLAEAGLEPRAESYPNWENTGLDGHVGGHYLTALALMYAADGDGVLLDRLHYMLDELQRAQQANGNGYIGGIPDAKPVWDAIAAGDIQAQNFSLNDRWVPLYNIHKLFAGLRDAWLIADIPQARDMLVDLTDWFVTVNAGLSDEQIQDMLRSEHGGLNEVFADVYAITGNPEYLDLAERYSHHQVLDPLLAGEDELTGMHANTQIPKVIGYQRVAELTDDEALSAEWHEAAIRFWDNVVNERTLAFGGNSVREHFNPVDDFSSVLEDIQGPETCNTYNMLRLTKMLFTDEPRAEYISFYERALYNHILSSQHPDGGFVYFTPIRPGHYRVYSQPHTSFWCCVGSGLENHGKYGELIYAHADDDLYVNLFIPSELDWSEQGVTVTQTTGFPYEEGTRLRVDVEQPTSFTLRLRQPGWLDGDPQLAVNGAPVEAEVDEHSYLVIDRQWENGDVVTLDLPMQTSVEYLPDGSDWAAFLKGPVVLAAVISNDNLTGMFADDSRMGHEAAGEELPLVNAPALVSSDPQALASAMVQTGPMTYTIDALIHGEEYKGVELVPFFSIHEARYTMYWPVFDEQSIDSHEETLQGLESE